MAKRRPPTFNYDHTLDLHGLDGLDAIRRLEDLMYRHVDTSIMIIHGRGGGVLKALVRDYLKGNPYVKETHYGEALNIPGGDGVTIIYV